MTGSGRQPASSERALRLSRPSGLPGACVGPSPRSLPTPPFPPAAGQAVPPAGSLPPRYSRRFSWLLQPARVCCGASNTRVDSIRRDKFLDGGTHDDERCRGGGNEGSPTGHRAGAALWMVRGRGDRSFPGAYAQVVQSELSSACLGAEEGSRVGSCCGGGRRSGGRLDAHRRG